MLSLSFPSQRVFIDVYLSKVAFGHEEHVVKSSRVWGGGKLWFWPFEDCAILLQWKRILLSLSFPSQEVFIDVYLPKVVFGHEEHVVKSIRVWGGGKLWFCLFEIYLL